MINFIFLFYQKIISPMLHSITSSLTGSDQACRFSPTCSEYSHQAFIRYGIIKGSFLSIKRIFRCHPWSKGGLDPLL